MGRRRTKLKRSISLLKKQYIYRRPITPFISSTFTDFQAERDILVKKVFPSIDAVCRERGTHCIPVDLRWGINDAQVDSGLIIQLCLDYVKRCGPFLVCLLGERYGAHRPNDAPLLPPSYDQLPGDAPWLDKNFVVAGSAGYDWVQQECYQHCSVTELEILQAFLGDTDHCFFYFRQPEHTDDLFTDLSKEERQERLKPFLAESDYSSLKVRDLKSRIVKKGLPVKYFRTPEELAVMALQDWKAVADRLYPPLHELLSDRYSEHFSEFMAHESFAETRRRTFVRSPDIDDLFERLSRFALSAFDAPPEDTEHQQQTEVYTFSSLLRKKLPVRAPYTSIMVLVGDRGCGKSSMLANWAKSFSDGSCHDSSCLSIFTHYVGSSAHSTSINNLLRRATYLLRDEFVIQGTSDGDSDVATATEEAADFHHVSEAFIASLGLGPCLLVVDGIDELASTGIPSTQQVKELGWLPAVLPPHCRIIFTTARSDATYRALQLRPDTKTLTVPVLDDLGLRREVIQGHLAVHCKCLDDSHLERVINCRLSSRPLFLSVLANELRVFSRLEQHLEGYLEASSVRDLWGRIIQRWIRDYGWASEGAISESAGLDNIQEYTGWVADALRLIAVSRHGLSQSEILDILPSLGYVGALEVTPFKWALFRSAAMDSLFERPGGLLTFFHQHFREAVEYSLFGTATPESSMGDKLAVAMEKQLTLDPNQSSRKQYHSHLADYFYKQSHSQRRTEELLYQLSWSGQLSRLNQAVADPQIFMDLTGDKHVSYRRIDLLHFWQVLTEAGYNAGSTYTHMIKQASGELREEFDVSFEIQENTAEPQTPSMTPVPRPPAPVPVTPISDVITPRSQVSESENVDVNTSLTILKDDDVDSISPPLHCSQTDLVQLGNSAGMLLAVLGKFTQAEELLLSSLDRLSGNYPLDICQQKLLCSIQESLGHLYRFQLKRDQAIVWFGRALESLQELLDDLLAASEEKYFIENKGRMLDQLGNMHTYDGHYDQADQMLQEAQQCMLAANSLSGAAIVQYHIAILRVNQRDYEEAYRCLQKALTSLQRWYGRSHPRVADVINELAGLLCNKNSTKHFDLQESEALYRRSLYIREQCFGKDHLLVATTLFHLGKLLCTQHSHPARVEALHLLKRSLDIRTKNLGADHALTKSVRRVWSIHDMKMKYKPSRPPDGRTDQSPHSSLTWRDTDLLQHEQRAARKRQHFINNYSKGRILDVEGRVEVHTERETASPWSGGSILGRTNSIDFMSYYGNDRGDENESITIEEIEEAARDEGSHSNQENPSNVTSQQSASNESRPRSVTMSNESVVRPMSTQPRPRSMSNQSRSRSMSNESPHRAISKSESLDTFAEVTSQKKMKKRTKSVHVREQEGVARPSLKLFRQYGYVKSESPVTSSSAVLPHVELTRDKMTRTYSAPPAGMTYQSSRPSSSFEYHHQSCYVPGPHSVDVHNTYSVVPGPNSSVDSLLGPPPCPRPRRSLQHMSAWYHVPGRYPTITCPFPPKRLHKRLSSKRHGYLTMETGQVAPTPSAQIAA